MNAGAFIAAESFYLPKQGEVAKQRMVRVYKLSRVFSLKKGVTMSVNCQKNNAYFDVSTTGKLAVIEGSRLSFYK